MVNYFLEVIIEYKKSVWKESSHFNNISKEAFKEEISYAVMLFGKEQYQLS